MIIMLLSQVVVKVEKWEGNGREKHLKEPRALTKHNGINAEVVKRLGDERLGSSPGFSLITS